MRPRSTRASRHLDGERGFTLIELLVAILIIGILAAIVIPSFLLTTSKADDTAAIALTHAARIATATASIDNNNSYTAITPALLNTYDPTIATTKKASKDAYLSAATGTATTYQLTATSIPTGNKFTLTRAANGTVSHTCTIPSKTSPHGECENVVKTTGTW